VFASFRAMVGPEVAAVALADEEEDQRRLFWELLEGQEGEQVYVAMDGAAIVGFVAVVLDHERSLGEISVNAVDPDHAGQGIGAAMYTFALDCMRAAGMKAAFVGTGAQDSQASARAAYARAGFDKVLPGVHLYREL
jgi:GNAT superfamily N-acetyltransferase